MAFGIDSGHGICCRFVTVLALLALGSPALRAADPPVPLSGSRVRSTDAAIRLAIDEAAARSATFRNLLAAIDHASGIVYVEPGYCSFGQLKGCVLPYIAPTQGQRYLRIVIAPDPRISHDQRLALIAHELQHGVEILDHPEVIDTRTMELMFRRQGHPIGKGLAGYETTAALSTGSRVLDELGRQRQASVQGEPQGRDGNVTAGPR
ncbi:MAG TPA: hypothetical protein VGH34_09565 [Vicinamibacterales bacterium]